MGASDYPGLRFPKVDKAGEGRVERARRSAADEKMHEIQIYHQVSVRDLMRCRCCSRRGSPRATSLLQKLHHDHIQERSLGGVTEAFNVCLLCARCHELKTQHVIEPEGNPDAGTLIFVMARAVAHEIFKGRRIPAHVRLKESA